MDTVVTRRPALTPKALIHQKYGASACYKIVEVQESSENICPGLVIPQHVKCLYKCHLELPGLSVTSGIFSKKKDAEQSAAKMAIETLGIQNTVCNPTPQEVWTEFMGRVSFLFTDEFLLSSHPMVRHFREAFLREGNRYGFVPLSIIIACDLKTRSLCKYINPNAETDTLLMILLVMKAASSHQICIPDGELWIGKRNTYFQETIQSVINQHQGSEESMQLQAVLIPYSTNKPIETLALDISPNHYYLDEIASKLNVKDSSRVLISRNVGKASSEMRLYFPAPELPSLCLDSVQTNLNAKVSVDVSGPLNQRASYLSGQNIYGDAILAIIGYTWKCSDLFHEHVSLSTYYRMLISKVPVGSYKLSREAMLAADLPTVYSSRSSWRGLSPKDLLSTFCRHHCLSEPLFDIEIVNSFDRTPEISTMFKQLKTNSRDDFDCENGKVHDGIKEGLDGLVYFRCNVKVLSRQQNLIIEYSGGHIYMKDTDAIQSSALVVLSFLNKYFKQVAMPMCKLSALGKIHSIHVDTEIFSKEFGLCLSAHGASGSNLSGNYGFMESVSSDYTDKTDGNLVMVSSIDGPDSGASPSFGCLVCISYAVALVIKDKCPIKTLESKDEFEFEIGSGAVIHHIETCVMQMSVNQTAKFRIEVSSYDLILAAAGEYADYLSQLSLCNCMLEYSVKVLRVTEPLEDRMEQALFKPPLSKQRVEFAVKFINETNAKTLVDFGCGSGSLLDSLLEHTTSLEKIVGVDISRKSLTRAAKILHSKLTSAAVSAERTCLRSAVLYDGSITVFDSRLHGLDVGTCLEVIEHMEEDEAALFGEAVLHLFCPRLLIVSTPNYEYNPILQRSSLSDKEDGGLDAPCKFRNHDHKFEWTRKQFECWATDLASRHNYSVEFSGVGGSGDKEPGFASQIAIFRRNSFIHEENLETDAKLSHPYEVVWEWKEAQTSDL